jgi:hypothetical protein
MPANTRQFSMALEALAELKMETAPPLLHPTPAAPTLDSVLADIGPLPREAMFLGVASDGLPVLLNLLDPTPGPLLIVGGAGSGKTRFLQIAAQSIARTHDPKDVQFGVITNHPDEWKDAVHTPHKAGVFSVHESGAQDFLLSLASWAHSNKNSRQSVLLLIDDLEAVASLDFDALQNLRWLLLRGPARRVWPVITMNAARYGQVISWIPTFRTRIFGRIEDERVAAALEADDASGVASLEAQIQFSLRENRNWLRFWLPSC